MAEYSHLLASVQTAARLANSNDPTSNQVVHPKARRLESCYTRIFTMDQAYIQAYRTTPAIWFSLLMILPETRGYMR